MLKAVEWGTRRGGRRGRRAPHAAVGRKEVRDMSPVTGFVLLTGLAAAFIGWLGVRTARTGYVFRHPHVEREHRKAA